jgi:hypothetical protein
MFSACMLVALWRRCAACRFFDAFRIITAPSQRLLSAIRAGEQRSPRVERVRCVQRIGFRPYP